MERDIPKALQQRSKAPNMATQDTNAYISGSNLLSEVPLLPIIKFTYK